MIIPLRDPCRTCECDGTKGEVRPTSGQDCVYCTICGRWQYNAPRIETGRAPRTVQGIHETIRPSVRAEVLLRAMGRCELCGNVAPDDGGRGLEVAHLVSVAAGLTVDLTEAELNAPDNLAAFCARCNAGIRDLPVPLRLIVAILRRRRTPAEP